MANTIGELNVEIGAKLDKLELALRRVETKVGQSAKKTESVAKGRFGKVASIIKNAFAIGAIIQFERKIIELGSEFQKFQAVLTTALGSGSLAEGAMASIQAFASKTPFSVRELTDAFVKLTNQGFKPTENEMRQLGDLAASTGKSFDQLAEGIIDAQVGEFERLKEFGIRASQQGDQVTFTFKGVTTTVDKTAGAIREYITALGDAEGVSGSMNAISKTLGGSISNMGDSFDALLVSLSDVQSFLPVVFNGMSDLATMAEASIRAGGLLGFAEIQHAQQMGQATFERYIKNFDDLVEKYGSSEAAMEAMEKAANNLEQTASDSNDVHASTTLQLLEQAKAIRRAMVELTELNQAEDAANKKRMEAAMAAAHQALQTKKLNDELDKYFNRLKKGEKFKEIDLTDLAEIGMEGEEGVMDQITKSVEKTTEALALAASVGNTFGGVLQSSFDAALISGENFAEVFGNAIKNLILQLISAAATATVLAAILAPISGVGFGATFRGLFLGTPGGGGGMGGNFGQFFVSGSNLVTSTNRARQQEGRSVR
jgi:hypothetical protein